MDFQIHDCKSIRTVLNMTFHYMDFYVLLVKSYLYLDKGGEVESS